VAKLLYHQRDHFKIRTKWRFNDPKGEEGRVLHCFCAVIPTTSDLPVEKLYAFTQRTSAFTYIDQDYSRIQNEKSRNLLFVPKARATVEVNRPFNTADEGPGRNERHIVEKEVAYASKFGLEEYGHSAFLKIAHHNNDPESLLLADGTIITKIMRPVYHEEHKYYHTIFHGDRDLTYDVSVWAVNAAGFGPVSHSHEQCLPNAKTQSFKIARSRTVEDIMSKETLEEFERTHLE
jgi:hypothetical protein